MKEYTGLEIAIIGMSGKFPGADNLDVFWDNLKNGVESVSFFTPEELIEAGEDKRFVEDPAYVRANSYLEHKENFDAAFFNYRPNEAKIMDPQIRIFHECVWNALEDAGLNLTEKKNKVGVFAGAASNVNWQVYAELINRDGGVDEYTASQVSNARFLTTKLSYFFNLKGPSVFVDTACSSSLVAVHQACRSLLVGDCTVAIAGGVRITNKAKKGYFYTEGMIHSRDGHCKAFDADASGTVTGEGAGVVVLKTLKNAIKDGDNILAIIKGSGINNDGNNKVGFTAPSVDGQAEAIMMAQKWARVNPESIGMIEAHGTGTALGDPIEIEGLSKAFDTKKTQFCAIGSVKTNIGHLDVAAGIAGLIKAVLSIRNRQIPPSLHYKKPNPKINFNNSPFYVNNVLRPWQNDTYPLRAGVSSFGIGGTNVHLILEEAPLNECTDGRKEQLLLLSAKTPAALAGNILNLIECLKNDPAINMADVAYTLQTARSHFNYRKSLACSSREEAITVLGELHTALPELALQKQKTVFMFTGQGAQYKNMYAALYNTLPAFKAVLDECLQMAENIAGINWATVLFGEGDEDNRINQTRYAQPALFMTEYALATVLQRWGIIPDMLIGHSIGEYVAACISGVFSLEDALRLVIKRGVLMQQTQPGAMLSISASVKEIQPLLYQYPNISIAAINSSSLCVVSGTIQDIKEFQCATTSAGINNKLLHTSHAFHSVMMDSILDEFRSVVAGVKVNNQAIPVISNLTGQPATDDELCNPDYWVKHLRNEVKFEAGIDHILRNEQAIFIEMGPGNTLSTFVRSNSNRTQQHKVVPMVRRQSDKAEDLQLFLKGLGLLWQYGINPSWQSLHEQEKRKKLSLHSYAFEKVAYPVNVDAYKMIAGLMGNRSENQLPVAVADGETANIAIPPAYSGQPTAQHAQLINIWNDFFGKTGITEEDDFFEIGGDSLKALTMANRLHKIYGVSISIRDFFDNSTVKKLGNLVTNLQLLQNSAYENKYEEIPKAHKNNFYKLSAAQRRLYFLYEFDKKSLAYNMLQAVTLKGKLDKEKLVGVFSKLITRHESLRTMFKLEGDEPMQCVAHEPEFSISCFTPGNKPVEDIVLDFVKPFDLSKDLPFRVGVVAIAEEENILMVDMHHIISDGVSQGVLIKDFMAVYNNDELPALRLQYGDFAEWQQSEEQKAVIGRQKEFWLKEFSDKPEPLELPMDFARPSVKSYAGKVADFEIGKAGLDALKAIAETEKTTMFMVLLAVYNILLHKLTGKEDIVIGTPSSGRTHEALDPIIGMFVNILPVRNRVSGNTAFRELLADVKRKVITCFDNQGYTYDSLVDELKIDRNTSHNMLFETVFSFENFGDVNLVIPGIELVPYSFRRNVSKFDISLTAVETANGLLCSFEYATTLFKESTIETFINTFRRIVSMITVDAGATVASLEMVEAAEKVRLVKKLDLSGIGYPKEVTIIDYFEQQVQENPEGIAVECYGEVISYKSLNEKANQLAHCLIEKGAGPDTIVGLYTDRSVNMVIAVLGVLKSGAAYLPLDIDASEERNRSLLADCCSSMLITTAALARKFNTEVEKICIDNFPGYSFANANPFVKRLQHHLCYVIYTSGTTGRPKGVMINHGNLVSLLFNNEFYFDFDRDDVWTMFHRYCFDFSVWELFGALSYGGKLIIVSKEDSIDPASFLQLVKDKRVTVLSQTPSAFYNLAQANFENAGLDLDLRYIVFGGEQLNVTKLKKWVERYPYTRLINMYGITETTVHNTFKYVDKEVVQEGISNIGKPLPTLVGYVLDKDLNLLPAGLTGELYIGGAGVARGYINNVELTHKRFLKNPYKPGDRLYKTGDGVKLTEAGELEYKGRLDNQVQLNGFRIELGEIENALVKYRFIKEAKVVCKEDNGAAYLVAYYIADKEITTPHLRNILGERLPLYMIPAYFVKIDKMPLTVNGKINVAALPAPLVVVTGNYVEPSTLHETRLAEVWMRVLSLPKIGVTDNYFALGGDSIKAIRLINQVNSELSVKIGIVDLYNNQTIRQMAGFIGTVTAGQNSQYYAAVEQALELFSQKYLENKPGEEIEAVYPMSNIEKGMCFVQMKHPEDVLYYEQLVWPVFYENFDISIVRKAIALLAKRHSAFRTVFDLKEFAHIIYKDTIVDIPFTDISLLDKQEQEDIIRQDLRKSRDEKFTLNMGALWKMAIYKIEDNVHFMTFDNHHAISDGWSISTFLNELNNTYAALVLNNDFIPEPLKSGYRDFIKEEMVYDMNPGNIEFWQNELNGFKKVSFGVNGNRKEFKALQKAIDKRLYEKLGTLSEKHNISLKTILFAACMYAIKAMNYENDITIGLVTFNREIGEDGENVFGNFLNTIPVRMIFDKGITGIELIERTDRKLLEIKPYDRSSLFNINKSLPDTQFSDNPISDILFNYTDFHSSYELRLQKESKDENALDINNFIRGNTLFDINIKKDIDGCVVSYTYVLSFIDTSMVERFNAIYTGVLMALTDNCDAVLKAERLMNKADARKLLKLFNNTDAKYPQDKTVVDLFNETVALHAENIAVVADAKEFSYAVLEKQSNSVANYLIDKNLPKNSVIGICIERSFEMIAGLMGILKAGHAYLPVDTGNPAERNAFIIENSGAKLVLTGAGLQSNFPAGIACVDLKDPDVYRYNDQPVMDALLAPEDTAYVIYTSGSTGRPKGVAVSHRALVNRLNWMQKAYPITSDDAVLQKTPFTFDVSVWELFWGFTQGARLVMLEPEGEKNPFKIADTIVHNKISVIHFVPSMLNVFLKYINREDFSITRLKTLKYVFASGEALPVQVANRFNEIVYRQVKSRLINLYGPTEATIDVSYFNCNTLQPLTKIPIGKPIDNIKLYILDKNLQLLPIGIPGELYIAGAGLAKGYINNKELTDERFISNPLNNRELIYKTGDMAKWMEDGNIEYLGRMDDQVKIRGFRIELGEIEKQLSRHPLIHGTAVVVREKDGDKFLTGYYVAEEEIDNLHAYLSESLPEYMVPAYFVRMNAIPVTANGKLNRKALPEHEVKSERYEQPATETEHKLVEIWSEVLKLNSANIGVNANFFELGGHSLKALELINLIYQGLNIEVPLKEVFKKITIRMMAEYIDGQLWLKDDSAEMRENTLQVII